MRSKSLLGPLFVFLLGSTLFVPFVVSAENNISSAQANKAKTGFQGPTNKVSASKVPATKAPATKVPSPKVLETNPAAFTSWVDPLNPPHAALLCIHGLGLNRDAYLDFATRMSRRGVATYAIDVRGFGAWMKAKGRDNLDFDATLNDVKSTLTTIRKNHPNLPVFLLGESMGGAIALRATSMYPELIQGLISSVPAGDRFDQKKQDLKVALQTLKRGPWHSFDIGESIVNQATENKKLANLWENDPLNRMDLSPMQLMKFQKFMNDNIDAARTVTNVPVLIVQGTLDKLVKPEGSWEIFTALGNKDKALIAFPSEHLIFEYTRVKSDADAAKAAQVAANWIYEHIPDAANLPLAYTAIKSRMDIASSKHGGGANMAVTPDAPSPLLQKAMNLYNLGKYSEALPAFQQITAAADGSFRARLWSSLCYEKLGKPQLALTEAFAARDQAVNADQKMRANQALMQLCEDPDCHPDYSQVKADAFAAGRPTVLLFGAGWCDKSRQNASLVTQGQKYFGDKVQFRTFNIDNVTDAEAARQLKVTAVPTFVFLKSDGSIRFSQFGPINFANFAQGIGCILN